jgi:hypothetical protein
MLRALGKKYAKTDLRASLELRQIISCHYTVILF